MGGRNFINSIITKILIVKGRSDVACMMNNAKNPKKANEKTLFKILSSNKNCEYGKKYDFAHIKTVEDFQKKVPVCTFKDLDAYVDRIYEQGEENVLTSDKIIGFSSTSGSVGKPKMIPLTDKQVSIYTKYTVTRMLALADEYWKERTGKGITHGFGLPMLGAFSGVSPLGLPKTNIVDIAARKYGFVYPYILDLPLGRLFNVEDADSEYVRARFGLESRESLYIFSVFANSVESFIKYIKNNWQMVADDIEKGIINEKIYMKEEIRARVAPRLKPNPKRAGELRREFEKGFDSTILSRIWPNMKFLNMIGTSPVYEPYIKKITQYTEGIPVDYSIYGASEGLFAAAYECNNKGQLMLLDSCFYEFIEQGDTADENKILTVDQLEKGREYEIIITNTSGLYRYRFNDVIKVLDFVGSCPVINFSYRKGHLVNNVSEKTNLEQMTAAMEMFCSNTGLEVKNWAVTITKGGPGGAYIVLLEGNDGTDFSCCSREMDEILCFVNTRYGEFRSMGLISPAIVKTLVPGTNAAWKEKKIAAGVSPEQVKPVTVLDTDEKKEFFTARVKA